jgi:hypothetical protein
MIRSGRDVGILAFLFFFATGLAWLLLPAIWLWGC